MRGENNYVHWKHLQITEKIRLWSDRHDMCFRLTCLEVMEQHPSTRYKPHDCSFCEPVGSYDMSETSRP